MNQATTKSGGEAACTDTPQGKSKSQAISKIKDKKSK